MKAEDLHEAQAILSRWQQCEKILNADAVYGAVLSPVARPKGCQTTTKMEIVIPNEVLRDTLTRMRDADAQKLAAMGLKPFCEADYGCEETPA